MSSILPHGDGSVTVKGDHGNFHITIGTQCIIKPLNPSKLKHRDRVCEFRGIVNEFDKKIYVASIKFLDNGRLGRCEFEELVPLK